VASAAVTAGIIFVRMYAIGSERPVATVCGTSYVIA
jgi:hypothetical protein